MMECVHLIIGGDRERKGERGKKSVDRLIQSNLGGREVKGPQCWGQRGGAVVDFLEKIILTFFIISCLS